VLLLVDILIVRVVIRKRELLVTPFKKPTLHCLEFESYRKGLEFLQNAKALGFI